MYKFDSPDDEQLKNIIAWGERHPLVRAMILTSTRAVPGAQPDIFSDYDVILILSDVRPFAGNREWLEAFGHVLVIYQDPLVEKDGFLQSGNVTQFEGDLKIDFSLWLVDYLRQLVNAPELDPELDAGYIVLLDKDQITAGLKPPTYRAYIPKPPSAETYQETVECFLQEAMYVAKYLWRDDVMAARYIMVQFMTDEHLLPMLEWQVEIGHEWGLRTSIHGRRLKKHLRPDLWADLEKTWVGAGMDDQWDALYRMVALMRKTAVEVGEHLGFPYPYEMERKSVAYLKKIQETPHIDADGD